MLIAKFGGTSVRNAASMLSSANILIKSAKPILAVLSASSGITDKLIETAQLASQGEKEAYLENCIYIKKMHYDIVRELIKDDAIKSKALEAVERLSDKLFELAEGIFLLNELTPRSLDAMQSFGELFSTNIFNYSLQDLGVKSSFFDARKIMRKPRHEDSTPYIDTDCLDFASLKKLLSKNEIVVTQGFVALDDDMNPTVIGRGGSDYSASLFGAALSAEEIQIWSDVNGILTTDPRNVASAKTINFIDFDEVREMSFFGAKVLHPDTIKPAMEKNIPVKCLNTFQPEHPGTTISNPMNSKPIVIKTMVYKNGCLLLTAKAAYNERPSSVLSSYLDILDVDTANVLAATMSESKIYILLDNIKYLEEPIFETILKNVNIKAEKCSTLTFCGKNIAAPEQFPKVFPRIASSLSSINPVFVFYGASPNSILCVLYDEISNARQTFIHDEAIG